MAKHFKELENVHNEKAIFDECLLKNYAWQYEKALQHDAMLQDMFIELMGVKVVLPIWKQANHAPDKTKQ